MQLFLEERPPRHVNVDPSSAEEGAVTRLPALDHDLVERAEQLRQIIDSPMLGLMLQMAPILEQMDLDDDDFYL